MTNTKTKFTTLDNALSTWPMGEIHDAFVSHCQNLGIEIDDDWDYMNGLVNLAQRTAKAIPLTRAMTMVAWSFELDLLTEGRGVR